MRHAELQRGHRQENGNCNTRLFKLIFDAPYRK